MRFLWPLINALQWTLACVWTAGWITVALAASAIRGRPDSGLALARRVWDPGLLRLAGARLAVEGRERIDPSRAYFFAANHQSWIDIPTLFAALPLPVLFLAKRELARVPFLGRYIEKMGMVFVDRAGCRPGEPWAEPRRACARAGASFPFLSGGHPVARRPHSTLQDRSFRGRSGGWRAGGTRRDRRRASRPATKAAFGFALASSESASESPLPPAA